MHVCWITTSFPRYEGDHAGVWFMGLAKGLMSRGVKLTVIAPHDAGTPRHESMRGVEVHRFRYWRPESRQRLCYGYGMPENVKRNPLLRFQLAPLFLSGALSCLKNTRNVDVIHAFWTLNAIMGAPARSIRRLPLLLTILGSGIRSAPRWLNRVSLSQVDAIVSATAEQCQLLAGYGYRGPLIDIKQTNMLDLQRLNESRPLESDLASWCAGGTAVVTFIARLDPFKDPVGFIRAVPDVLQSHPNARFLVVGDGSARPEVESEIARLGIEASVRLTGMRDNVGSLLRASTVFVANSPISNCYSATILEAMEVGVPCVVTDVGDPTGSFTAKDYVEPVRPNDPVDLARGIVRLLADPGLRQRRSRMGRLFLEDYGFNADTVLDRSVGTYRALMQRRHRKPGSWPTNLQNHSG